jgi:hypothetical protein
MQRRCNHIHTHTGCPLRQRTNKHLTDRDPDHDIISRQIILKEAVVLARASEHVDTLRCLGEITLTKGKDPDPSTTRITTVKRCRGVNAWYGKRKL